jgi:ParB family chromosome partitioning protein
VAYGQSTSLPEAPIEKVVPNPKQPRRAFRDDLLHELAQSIRTQGIIQPLVVRPVGDHFELIAGERRWRAARMAGLTRVPIVVNVQREDLNPIDRARAYRSLIEDFGTTQEALADALGRSRTSITNTLRLLRLPSEIQEQVASGAISEGHGRALLAVTSDPERQRLWRRIVDEGLSVRETEDRVRKLTEGGGGTPGAGADGRREAAVADPFITDLEDQLRTSLGTEVRIRPGKDGAGMVTVRYYDNDDLERILELLLGKPSATQEAGPGV